MIRLLKILSFSILITNIGGSLNYLLELNVLIIGKKLFLGQPSNYSCSTDDLNVDFSLSFLSHSAWESTTNCTLSKCNINSTMNTRCYSLSVPCFNYRTINNVSICAPAVECSILELCNNNTSQCTSNTSVCVINSCCSIQAVCLPLSMTSFCSPGNNIH